MPRSADPALELLWQQRLLQQAHSGLTILQFCRRERVSPASFHAWKRRLNRHATPPAITSTAVPAFVPVRVTPEPTRSSQNSADHVTIQLTNGDRILLPITADPGLVCQVVSTVAQAATGRERASC